MARELARATATVCADWARRNRLSAAEAEVELVTGSLTEVMEMQQGKVRPDLIALGAHTRHALASHVIGSFAAGLVRDPPTDLLIAHPSA